MYVYMTVVWWAAVGRGARWRWSECRSSSALSKTRSSLSCPLSSDPSSPILPPLIPPPTPPPPHPLLSAQTSSRHEIFLDHSTAVGLCFAVGRLTSLWFKTGPNQSTIKVDGFVSQKWNVSLSSS